MSASPSQLWQVPAHPWLAPTLRATSWWPLTAMAGYLAVITAVAAYAGAWPPDLLAGAAAGLAAATVAGLRDPAAALLSSLPVSAAERRAHRLALLLPAEAAIWLAWVGVGHQWSPDVGWPVTGLAALTMAALAAAVWAPPDLAVPIGVGLPLAIVTIARIAEVRWDARSEVVLLAAIAALMIGRNR